MDYISREEAIKALYEVYEHEYPTASGDFDEYARHDVQNILNGLPAADVQPVKHGRWILSDDKNWLTCSSCGADVDVSCGAPFFYVDNDYVSHINFCPNCGAKMDLKDGDING